MLGLGLGLVLGVWLGLGLGSGKRSGWFRLCVRSLVRVRVGV